MKQKLLHVLSQISQSSTSLVLKTKNPPKAVFCFHPQASYLSLIYVLQLLVRNNPRLISNTITKMSAQTSPVNKVFVNIVTILMVILILTAGYGFVQANLVAEPDIISAPASVEDDAPGATNSRQQAFNERQHVTLPRDTRCDSTTLPAGEVVSSHMIFFNTPLEGVSTDADRTWTFEDEIICVMSNGNGIYQGESDWYLGHPNTYYPGPFPGHGLESDDSYSVNGNSITVTMNAEEPGDWIRVVTRPSIPEDTTAPVVYCENAAEKGNSEKTFVLVGADDTDGAVEIFLTDIETETEFGPFSAGTIIRHTIAKGAKPSATEANGKVEYAVKSQGELQIHATDTAGNEGSAVCH